MIQHIMEMLKLAEQYNDNEIIATAKGKYEYPKSNYQLFKKLLKIKLNK
jgi:hypothetical protein